MRERQNFEKFQHVNKAGDSARFSCRLFKRLFGVIGFPIFVIAFNRIVKIETCEKRLSKEIKSLKIIYSSSAMTHGLPTKPLDTRSRKIKHLRRIIRVAIRSTRIF